MPDFSAFVRIVDDQRPGISARMRSCGLAPVAWIAILVWLLSNAMGAVSGSAGTAYLAASRSHPYPEDLPVNSIHPDCRPFLRPTLQAQMLRMASSTLVAMMLLSADAHAQSADPVQWRSDQGGNGHWYQLKVQPARRFWDLVADARAAGSYLVSVRSPEENQFVRSISVGHFVHFGAIQDHALPTYAEPSGGWTWVSGEPWEWAGWCSWQPDDAPWGGYSGQDLARFNSASGTCWDDAHSQAQIATINLEATMFEWSADCNNDGIVDFGQIRTGALPDQNGNNIPDGCECQTHPELAACCPGDVNGSHTVDGADVGALLAFWGEVTTTTLPGTDINHDGVVNGADLGLLLSHWGACP